MPIPSPSEHSLRRKFPSITAIRQRRSVKQPFHFEGNMKPRYYQQIAVDKTLEAIANGKDRVLLTLGNGYRKNVYCFSDSLSACLRRSGVKLGVERRPKVLFLADRNVLADQAFNTFNPLGKRHRPCQWLKR